MKMLIVWVLSANSPVTLDYAFYPGFFHSELECIEIASKIVIEKPFELTCMSAAVWVPSKVK